MNFQPEENDLVTINMRALTDGQVAALQAMLEEAVEIMPDEVNGEAIERIGGGAQDDSEDGERYVIEMDMYVHAKSDEEAVKLANEVAEKIDGEYDNKASVTGVFCQPFATMGTRKVELNV